MSFLCILLATKGSLAKTNSMHEKNGVVLYHCLTSRGFSSPELPLSWEIFFYKHCSLHSQISCSHCNKSIEYAIWIPDSGKSKDLLKISVCSTPDLCNDRLPG